MQSARLVGGTFSCTSLERDGCALLSRVQYELIDEDSNHARSENPDCASDEHKDK